MPGRHDQTQTTPPNEHWEGWIDDGGDGGQADVDSSCFLIAVPGAQYASDGQGRWKCSRIFAERLNRDDGEHSRKQIRKCAWSK